ncbi:MAG: hemerythrin domain-containing protein [Rhodothermales bacterium]
MSTDSRSVASRIQEEHESLKSTMAAIRAELESGVSDADFPDWKLGFIWRLRDFQSALLKHFDLEEDGGFMQDLVAISPGCAVRVDRLKQEHDEVIPRLNGLTDQLKVMPARHGGELDRVIAGVIDLFDMLECHEAAERELIQDVYFQDIGVGD